MLATLELFSWATFKFSDSFDKTAYEQRLLKTAEDPNKDINSRRAKNSHLTAPQHVIHPYVGFVENPKSKKHQLNFLPVSEPVNELGYFGPMPLMAGQKKESDFVVAITGGSVAAELYLYSREHLRFALAASALLRGKRIHFVSLALGGMKQPQQLLAVTYLVALGYKFDMVINIDGFNEAVLPLAENIKAGVYPFFPRKWHLYAAKALPLSAAVTMSAIASNRQRLDQWQRLASHSWFKRSNFVALVFGLYDQSAQRELMRLESILEDSYLSDKLAYQQSGPIYKYAGDEQTIAESVDLWAESSEILSQTASVAGYRYYHFLQPNQYVPDSKPFSSAEHANALLPESHELRKITDSGYRRLMESGRGLPRKGINYYDLTMLFANDEQTLYKDPCCHLNQAGSDILASRVGSIIAEAIESEQTRPKSDHGTR